MSSSIERDLVASGVAPVIVVLKQGGAGASAAADVAAAAQQTTDISKYFTTSEHSQASALTADAAARVSLARGGSRQVSRSKAFRDAEESVAAALDFRARPAVVRKAVPEAEPPALVRYYPNLGVALGTVTRDGLAALRKDGTVDQVLGAPELGLIHPTRTGAATLRANTEWGIQRLGAPALWKKGITGKGIRVGHLDTGVDGKHPALKPAIAEFAEFDNLGRQVVPAPAPHDTGEHGSHTAGTIAGRPQGGRQFGMAPGAELVCGIVIEGGQVVARVLGGMDWCVGEGVRILSMSLGLRGWWPDFLPLTQILRVRGILPVFAAGNEGPGTSRSPGNYAEALSIGAIDRNNDIATFSSSQLFSRPKDPIVPDVVAPGVAIVSARPGGGYQSMDGTSMATPHIAGLAALLLEANPGATVDELEQAILGSAALKPGWAPERAGKGLPAARKALKAITT